MQHSVKNIGNDYEKLSIMRNDEKQFNANDFFQFAKNRIEKYGLIESDDDLLVSTWYCNSLIDDYRLTIQNEMNLSGIITPDCDHKGHGSRIVFGERRCAKCGALYGYI